MMNKELFEIGLQIRREVLGAEYVDKSISQADDFNRPLQELVTEYCWGKGALNNDCSKEEIMEVLLQTAIYCGVPAAVDSFRLAREVFSEIES
jgi:4-carboxymuconolactone decarboxylase